MIYPQHGLIRRLHRNYKGTGETRTNWRIISEGMISQDEYPGCHRIAETMFAIAHKINESGLYTINQKINASNEWSEFEYKNIQYKLDWPKRHKVLSFLWDVMYEDVHGEYCEKEKKENNEVIEAVKLWNGQVNYSEVKALRKIKASAHNHDDKMKQIAKARNMVAYQVNQIEAIRINVFEEVFQKCFKVPYSRESVQALLRG